MCIDIKKKIAKFQSARTIFGGALRRLKIYAIFFVTTVCQATSVASIISNRHNICKAASIVLVRSGHYQYQMRAPFIFERFYLKNFKAQSYKKQIYGQRLLLTLKIGKVNILQILFQGVMMTNTAQPPRDFYLNNTNK